MTDLKSPLINTLQERGFIKDATDLAYLDEACANGPIAAYIGFDATAASLHVGSMIQLMILRHLRAHGHRAIALMGHATTLVGDPSDKNGLRPMLDEDAIRTNAQGIENLVTTIVPDVEIRSNLDWFGPMSFLQFMREHGRHFTVNRMLSMDVVARRIEQNKPLTIMEFGYMLMQSVDFLELRRREDCILQCGGSDQWSNIIGGVELIRKADGRQAFGITTPLMTDDQGRKMGKTAEGKAIWLDPAKLSSFDLWQFWRNVPDSKVPEFLGLFTELPMDEVRRLAALAGSQINEAKIILATEAVAIAHGRKAAEDAARAAAAVFGATGIDQAMTSIDCPWDYRSRLVTLADIVVHAGLAPSKAAARRLADQKGLRANDALVTDADAALDPSDFPDGSLLLSVGKKRRVLVRSIKGPVPKLPSITRVEEKGDGTFSIEGLFDFGSGQEWDTLRAQITDRTAAEMEMRKFRTETQMRPADI